jgi:hypothetical protein
MGFGIVGQKRALWRSLQERDARLVKFDWPFFRMI